MAGNCLGVVQKLRQQFWNYFELLFPYSEKNVCTYETDRIGEKQPKETGNVNLIFERLLTHAGRISQQMAQEKAEMEFNAFKITQRCQQREDSLKELEEDLKQLKPCKKKEGEW